MSECEHIKVLRVPDSNRWVCEACAALFMPEAFWRTASERLDAACIAMDCVSEELADRIRTQCLLIRECGDALGVDSSRMLAEIRSRNEGLAQLTEINKDGHRALAAQRDDARDAARELAHLLRRVNDHEHKHRAEEIDAILRDGGIE